MNKNLFLLILVQAILQSSNILFTSTAALIGLNLTEKESLSTIPLFLNNIFSLVTTIPASILLERLGRKKGFTLGAFFGFFSVIFFVSAISEKNFYSFLIGSSLLGISASFANFIRYTAPILSNENFKTEATSLILTGGVIAAIIGPNLPKFGKYFFKEIEFLGGYTFLFIFFLTAIVILFLIQFPKTQIKNKEDESKFKNLLEEKNLLKIILLCMISSWVMIFIMSATPLGMKSKEYSIDEITNVIQFHILGMFVPSFFTGNLIKKFGLRIILFIGIFFCMLCVFINLLNHSNHHYLPSLILLGIGWNFLFVGSTRILLTNINEKLLTKAQALNDFSVTGFTSISLAFTGLIHSKLGYENLNLITIPFLFIAIYLSLDLTKKKLMKTK